MWTVSCIAVISVLCLSWTSPSHAGCQGLMIDLRAEMNQMSAAMDEMIAEIECPENFTSNGSSCYHFSEPLIITEHGNCWIFARVMCWLKGSDLVSIESEREAEFLKENAVSGNYWTSAHKHGSVFVWETTGANVAIAGFSPWVSGEPNTAANECAVFNGNTGKMYDLKCAAAGNRYICETRL